MSSDDITGRRGAMPSRRAVLTGGLAIGAIGLAGCTVQPLYGTVPGSSGATTMSEFKAIRVDEQSSRVQQVLRNALIYDFTRRRRCGRPSALPPALHPLGEHGVRRDPVDVAGADADPAHDQRQLLPDRHRDQPHPLDRDELRQRVLHLLEPALRQHPRPDGRGEIGRRSRWPTTFGSASPPTSRRIRR